MAFLDPYNGVLGERLAKHLLRRATYRVTRANIESFATMTANAAVEQLFTTSPLLLTEPIDWETGAPWINNPSATVIPPDWKAKNYIKAWWLNEALYDTSITSKLKMFLNQYMTVHTDFASADYLFDYMSLLGLYAKGSYKELAHKMVTDNTMSSYLDNRWNHRWNPNENFAREFLELFTIGKGEQIGPGNYTNYQETDVQEAARLLTGWRFGDRYDAANIDADTGLARNLTLYSFHDPNSKTFSSAFDDMVIEGAVDDAGMWAELQQFVDMIFAKEATAKTLCLRLYRFFVSWDIPADVETTIIPEMVTTCMNTNYNIAEIVKQLLKSEHFYNIGATNKIIGKIIKAPMDNVLQTMSFFQIDSPNPLTDGQNHYQNFWWYGVMDNMLERSGFNFFEPNNVAGYPAYYQSPTYARDWFSSATILARYKMPEQFLTGTRVLSWGDLGGVQLNIVDFVQNSGVISDPSDATGMVNELCNFLFPEMPDADRLSYFLNDVFLLGLTPTQWSANEWGGYLSSGDDSGVKIALERLIKGLLYAQEYQLM